MCHMDNDFTTDAETDYDEDWEDYQQEAREDWLDESFEWESSMASAGWGTDEDYGCFDSGDDWGE